MPALAKHTKNGFSGASAFWVWIQSMAAGTLGFCSYGVRSATNWPKRRGCYRASGNGLRCPSLVIVDAPRQRA
jgi:hypothetical protein